MKLNIQSMHTPGLLLATNLVQLANSIAHARSLVAAAYSHAREIATAEANHEAADFCGDPYAHNCGRPHCRPSDSYTGPQPPLVRRFFEVDALAEAAPPAAGVPEGLRELLEMLVEPDARKVRYASDWRKDVHNRAAALLQALSAATPPASEQQRAVVTPEGLREAMGKAASSWLYENDPQGLDWCDTCNVDALLDALFEAVPQLQLAKAEDKSHG